LEKRSEERLGQTAAALLRHDAPWRDRNMSATEPDATATLDNELGAG